jgi:hypothetical protein
MTAVQNINALSDATQLLPLLRSLQQHEKLFVIQFLVAEMSRQQQGFVLPEGVYPVWSPYDSYEAADLMLQAIQNRQAQAAI